MRSDILQETHNSMLNWLMKIQTWCNGNSVSINTNASEFDHNLMFIKFLRF